MSGSAPAPTALVASAVSPEVSGALQIYEQLKPLKDSLGVGNLSDQELQLFALVAKHTGLDPFSRQIYAVKRSGKVTHQTGIDGYRSIAERTGQYAGSDEAAFEACDCGEDPKDHPKIARVTVHRVRPDGIRVEQVGVARWHELYPGKGDDGFMWRKMPHGQLAKCAEANGMRKAFPRTFGGVYIADEMQGGEVLEGQATEVTAGSPKPGAKDRIAARRAEAEAAAPTADQAPDIVEGSFTEDPETTQPVAFRQLLIDLAHEADDTTRATKEEVQALLDGPLEGYDKALIRDGLVAVWNEDAVGKPTVAQLNAIARVAAGMTKAEFLAAWRDLAGSAPAAA